METEVEDVVGASKAAALIQSFPGLQWPESGGIIRGDIPHAVYHRRELGVASKGALDLVDGQSLGHYLTWANATPEEVAKEVETPAMRFGRALHAFILEPETFESAYLVHEKLDRRFKAGKTRWLDLQSQRGDRDLLDQDDFDAIRWMAEALGRHPLARNLMIAGRREVTLLWRDPGTEFELTRDNADGANCLPDGLGLPCKARADFWIPELRMAFDLKSTEDASFWAFRKTAANFRYHVQDAHYSDGFAACGEALDMFLFAAVEKTKPFGVNVFLLDDAARDKGNEIVRRAMVKLAEAMRTREFPTYSDTIQDLSLPSWAFDV
jgi:hypothetical protein